MLSSIQKFSTSIFAKILLVIIIIPFVFWGMGSTFRGGDKNVIVVIEKEKHTVQEFIKDKSDYTHLLVDALSEWREQNEEVPNNLAAGVA